jgi:putative membrane protein
MRKTTNLIRTTSLVALLALGFAINGARADDKGSPGSLTAKDFKFVCEGVTGGQNEINLSQVALQKASDQSVKDFAQRMVQDHQKANQELTQLATSKGATLPDTDTKKSEKMAEHLQNLSGTEFDKAYMKDMVGDHKKVVKMFQKESERADDGDLKSWVTKTLPTLEDHLRMAQSVEGALNGNKVAAQ